MRRNFAAGVTGLVVFLTALLSNCSNAQMVTESKSKGEGIALLKISIKTGSPFSKIAKTAVLTVSAPDMLTMTKPLSITDTSVEGLVKGIPAGKNRLFEVSVFDSLEVLQYKGSATATVVADTTVSVFISVYRINGNALINGTIIDEGPAPDLDPNLVAYWSFDASSGNTYFDVTGHGFDATSAGLSLAAGIKGMALNCPGSGYELIAKNSKESFILPRFTIETWFYSNVDINLNDMFCKLFDFQCITSGLYNGYGIHIDAEGKVVFGLSNSTVSWVAVVSKTAILPKTWYHIVCTFDGTTLTEYINGAVDGATSFSGMYAAPGVNARIACQTLTDGTVRYPINGKLDELKLYKIALTADVVKAKYEESKPRD
jgi:hypothetical protein